MKIYLRKTEKNQTQNDKNMLNFFFKCDHCDGIAEKKHMQI